MSKITIKKNKTTFILLLAALSLVYVHSETSIAANNSKVNNNKLFSSVDEWKGSIQNPENPSDLILNKNFPDKQWWLKFKDECLNRYIQQALASNEQLAIAKERINESRALARYTLGNQFPNITFAPSAARSKNSSTTFTSSQASVGSTASAITQQPYNYYSLPLQANYEVDFLLKNRDITKSANKLSESTIYDYQTAYIALVTDVASVYFNLVAEDKLIYLQKNYIYLSGKDLEAERYKYLAGQVSPETVAIKQELLSEAKASLQEFYRLQNLYVNELAILMGKTPEEVNKLPRSDFDKFEIPSIVDAGIPSSLITRRPDILSAEKLLEKSKIDVRVARKELFPTINLTGQIGAASTSFNKLSAGSSSSYSLGGSLIQTIFNGGSNLANIKVYKARYNEQMHQYRQTILTALQEVETSLESVKDHRNQYHNYSEAYVALNSQLAIQINESNEGAIALSDLYPTQIQTVQSEEGLVNSKLLGIVDAVNLYKALGGGY